MLKIIVPYQYKLPSRISTAALVNIKGTVELELAGSVSVNADSNAIAISIAADAV
jgi:hypothetical protein